MFSQSKLRDVDATRWTAAWFNRIYCCLEPRCLLKAQACISIGFIREIKMQMLRPHPRLSEQNLYLTIPKGFLSTINLGSTGLKEWYWDEQKLSRGYLKSQLTIEIWEHMQCIVYVGSGIRPKGYKRFTNYVPLVSCQTSMASVSLTIKWDNITFCIELWYSCQAQSMCPATSPQHKFA